jgi:hypothetical protein
VSASSGAASPFKMYHRTRANLALWARHARGPARATWWPAQLALNAATMAWLATRGRAAAAAAVAQALWDAALGRPAQERRW